jgi:uncharacterized protein (DUF58 family)
MKRPFPVGLQFDALLIYAFCVVLVYLAGTYLSSIMLFIFYALITFPIVSVLLFLISTRGISFTQEFSTEHPVKGEAVGYEILIANESTFPVAEMNVRFISANPLMEHVLTDFVTPLKRGQRIRKQYSVECAYRGVYQVGLRNIDLRDMSHFLRVSIPVWHRSFYVYPRIVELPSLAARLIKTSPRGERALHGGLPDYALFHQLHEYKEGDSIRHLYWKKFATTGIPFIKEYESPAEVGVAVYFDLRRSEPVSPAILAREDATVEIVVALIKFLLDRALTVSVYAPGREIYEFHGSNNRNFEAFYKSTVNLLFQETYSPAEIFRAHQLLQLHTAESTFFITHLIDDEILNLLEEALSADRIFTLIFNHTNSAQAEKEQRIRVLNSFRDRGMHIIDVHSSETIVDDMREKTDDK